MRALQSTGRLPPARQPTTIHRIAGVAAAADAATEAMEEHLQCLVCYDLPKGIVNQVRASRDCGCRADQLPLVDHACPARVECSVHIVIAGAVL